MPIYVSTYRDGGSVTIKDSETKTQYFIDYRIGSDTRGLVYSNPDDNILVTRLDAKEVARELRTWWAKWRVENPDTPFRAKQNAMIAETIERATNDLEFHYDQLYANKQKEATR